MVIPLLTVPNKLTLFGCPLAIIAPWNRFRNQNGGGRRDYNNHKKKQVGNQGCGGFLFLSLSFYKR